MLRWHCWLVATLVSFCCDSTGGQVALSSADASSVENEWYLPTTDQNARIYVWEVGHGEPVIVVHGGFGAEHSYLFDVVRGLTDRFRFIFYDQRGSLRSRCKVEHISFEKHVEDLHQLQTALGEKQVSFVAHSMGTVITMQYLMQYPETVKNLVLMGALAADTSFRGTGSEALEKFRKRPEIEAEKQKVRESGVTGAKLQSQLWRISFAGSNTYRVDRWRRMKGGQAFYNQKAGSAAGKTLPGQWDFTPALAKSAASITIINGDHDFVDFDGEYYRSLAAKLPELHFELLEQAGHNSWIDQPERCRRALTDGLSRAAVARQ